MPPAADATADLAFPTAGLDEAASYARQRPGTTPVGTNVLAYEPTTDRARGGSRAGVVKYVAQQVPAGEYLIQHLNTVVLCTTEALTTNDEPDDPDPITGLPPIDDPSSIGPPDSWGRGIIVRDELGNPVINPDTGLPYTGGNDGSRNPGGPGSQGTVHVRKIRDGGSAVQPNKNTLTHAQLVVTKYLYQGFVQIRMVGGSADDTYPSFATCVCHGINGASAHAMAHPNALRQIAAFVAQVGGGWILIQDPVVSDTHGVPLPIRVCTPSDATACA